MIAQFLIVALFGGFLQCEGFSKLGLRIVNGTSATEGEFPYVVSLRIWGPERTEIHWCGGSIISEKFILTAGHCLDEQLIFARIGRIDLDDLSDNHTYSETIRKAYLHPDYYKDLNSVNDLALIELVTPLSFSGTIQPVQLPEPNADIPFNRKAWVTGWGIVNDSLYEPSPILQKVSVTLLPNNYCQSQLKDDYLIDQNLCAGDWLNTKGHCSGDSGGPLVINGVQWGIVSWSLKPCISAPGVYTSIANPSYRDWIQEIAEV